LTNLDRGMVSAQINHKGIVNSVQLDYHYGQDYICVTCIN